MTNKFTRWIHYWYDDNAVTDFRKTVLKMMTDLFFEKLAGDLIIPETNNGGKEEEVVGTNTDNFLIFKAVILPTTKIKTSFLIANF